jgi:mannosyltransferase
MTAISTRRAATAPAGLVPGRLRRSALRATTWCGPAILTLILGFYQAGRPELWRDELASWSFASRPVPALLATVQLSGATQVAYYLLLHYWIALAGASAIAMRSVSVLAMTGAAACVACAGRRLAGAQAGLAAGLAFAVVPSTSRYAQEVRYYAPQVLLAAVATLLLLRAVDKPSAGRWSAYAASLAALGYLDITALALISGHAAWPALHWNQQRDRRLLRFIPAVGGAAAACLPMIIAGASQQAGQLYWLTRPGLSLGFLGSFCANLCYSIPVAVALLGLGVLAWLVNWRPAAFCTAGALLPVAAVWIISQGPQSYFWPRYLLYTVISWALLAGLALSKVRPAAAVAALAMLGLLGAGDQVAIRERGAHNWAAYPAAGRGYPDYAAAAAYIAARDRTGDGIVYQPGGMMINLGLAYYLPDGPRPLFISRTPAQAHWLYPAYCQHPARCLGDAARIWIVVGGHPRRPYRSLPPAQTAVLRAGYTMAGMRRVHGLTVFLLDHAVNGRSTTASSDK